MTDDGEVAGAAAPRRARRARPSVATVLVATIAGLLVVAMVVTVAFWMFYRPQIDPIDVAPVNALAEVVSSPSCGEGGATTVRVLGLRPSIRTQISGCGFVEGSEIAIQYLAGNPDLARRAGSAVAGPARPVELVRPLLILGAALALTVGAALLLRYERRRRRRARRSRPFVEIYRRLDPTPAVTVDRRTGPAEDQEPPAIDKVVG